MKKASLDGIAGLFWPRPAATFGPRPKMTCTCKGRTNARFFDRQGGATGGVSKAAAFGQCEDMFSRTTRPFFVLVLVCA